MAETLLKNETLSYEDVERLIGPPPFGRKRLIEPADFEESLRKGVGENNVKAKSEDPASNRKMQ